MIWFKKGLKTNGDKVKKRHPKSPRTKLEEKLDALWRTKVGSETCAVCDTLPLGERINYTKLDPHHVIGRTNRVLRWDLKNRVWLCTHHHVFGRRNAQDNIGGWFLNWESDNDWMGINRPEDKEYLRERHHQTRNWRLSELEELCETLKQKISEQE